MDSNHKRLTILCPRCDYRPTHVERWICEPGCGAYWNTFWTRGLCPVAASCGTSRNVPSAAKFRRTGNGIARPFRTSQRRKRAKRSSRASDAGSVRTSPFTRLTVEARVHHRRRTQTSLACIACDTLASIGSVKQKAHYCAMPDKIFGFRDTWIGTVGYAVHNAVLKSYFARHADDIKLGNPAEILRLGARCIACCARSIT